MRVSKETAILLKEAGYDVPCAARYDLEGELQEYEALLDHNEYVSHCHSVPTLHEAADWLRSKGVHVSVKPYTNWTVWIWDVYVKGKGSYDGGLGSSHEAAYEAGIVHGLKYLP